MIKPIKFDLKLSDGTTTLRTLDDLEENLTPELFQHFQSGKLAKWLRVRKLDELADKMEALLAAEKEHEVQLLKSLCEIFVSEINEENARQAMQHYKKSNSQQVNTDDEVERLEAEIEGLKIEIEKLKNPSKQIETKKNDKKNEIDRLTLTLGEIFRQQMEKQK
jgi:septal ring factor EnvC (AmiA/AmiB activator)